MEDVLKIIFKRRSIRIFTHEEVEKDTLVKLLQAAMAAPSASNSRPWEFIVVTDKNLLKQLQLRVPYGKYNAPAAIVVLANHKVAKNTSSLRFWVQDCSAATENILLAAAGLGLGTVWIGVYPKEDNIKTIAQILDIPKDVVPLSMIYVGYPAEEKPPRTQYEESRVHWQRYRTGI